MMKSADLRHGNACGYAIRTPPQSDHLRLVVEPVYYFAQSTAKGLTRGDFLANQAGVREMAEGGKRLVVKEEYAVGSGKWLISTAIFDDGPSKTLKR